MDIIQRAKAAKDRVADWYTRQDEDIARYLLEAFIWKDSQGRKMPSVEHITLNDPRTFADRIVFQLGTAERRFDILAEEDAKASEAEKFLKFGLKEADDNLLMSGEWPIEEMNDWGTALRGGIATRALLKSDGSMWDFDIVSADVRGVAWEPGKKGNALVDFYGKKTAAEVKRDYDLDITEKEIEVEDIWTEEENHLSFGGKEARPAVTHNLGMNPAFVVKCPTSPRIAGRSDAVKHEAESVYAPVRDMYEALNKSASAWETSNLLSILPTLQFISKDGRKSKVPPFGIKAVVNLRTGEEYKAIPIKDVSMSHQAFFGQIMARIQRATYSNLDYGDLSFELSALAIKRLEAAKDQLYIPRLRAKKMMMIWLSNTLIKQFINGGYKTDLGDSGVKLPFKRSDLLPKFQIQVSYFSTSPDENIANATIAQTYKTLGFPEEYIYKQIAKVEDYPELLKMRDKERALIESEAARKFQGAMSLIDSGDPDSNIQAQLILKELGLSIQMQKQGGGGTGGKPLPQQASQPNLPLGLTQNLVASRPRSDEAMTQREEQRRQKIFQKEKSSTAQEV